MARKPEEITGPTVHNCWDYEATPACPVCGSPIRHEFNDGGRISRTLLGPVWVVTNYYKCENPDCSLHATFPAVRESVVHRKRFALDVWAQVIWYHVEVHLNYKQIRKVLAHDWQVFLSKGAVRDIIQYFEVANSAYQDETTREAIRANGTIVLSLDGAQPEKGEPSLWVFTDRLTGKVLLARVYEAATHEALAAAINEVVAAFGVPVIAVISDRQENVVQAVQAALPGVPHAYCHYHFLRNVARPVEAKDSHLQTTLRSGVRKMHVIQEAKKLAAPGGPDVVNPAYVALAPLAEELLCAVAARGDSFRVFPGLETYANLEHVHAKLGDVLVGNVPRGMRRALEVSAGALEGLLADARVLRDETAALREDFDRLREILGKRERHEPRVREEVRKFAKMLQDRLKRRGLEHDPTEIKWQFLSHASEPPAVWQEWVRLIHTHEAGLFVAYDIPGVVEFTNNPKEQLFGQTRAHLRALYGRKNVSKAFQVHGPHYMRMAGAEWGESRVREVMLASEEVIVNVGVKLLRAQYATTRRRWQIREVPTGNWDLLDRNLREFDTIKND